VVSLKSSVGDSNLGSAEVGATGTALPFSLSSTSGAQYYIPSLSGVPALSGPDAADFTITPGTCVAGAELSTTTSCAATVTFTPKSVGSKTATVTANAAFIGPAQDGVTGPVCAYTAVSNSYACTVSFTVSGTAMATPSPTVSAALTPATRVVTAGRTATVTLTASNAGKTALSNVTTTLPIPRGFRFTNRGGGTLAGGTLTFTAASVAVGASSTYTVTLRPIGLKARKATLTTTVSATGATAATATGTITVRAAKVKKKPVPVVG